MDPLSAQDASFLEVEDEVSHMHIGVGGHLRGSAAIAGGIPCRRASAKLDLVPRYRQKVRYPPLHVGPPVWIDDPHFNLDYHLRRTALASPGGETELRALVGRVMSQQLDRHKPLWEMWIVDGLGDGRWALVSKVHHCMVDGVSGTDLMAVLLDASPNPRASPTEQWSPALSRRRARWSCSP